MAPPIVVCPRANELPRPEQLRVVPQESLATIPVLRESNQDRRQVLPPVARV